jgi:hypothetical protein
MLIARVCKNSYIMLMVKLNVGGEPKIKIKILAKFSYFSVA